MSNVIVDTVLSYLYKSLNYLTLQQELQEIADLSNLWSHFNQQ